MRIFLAEDNPADVWLIEESLRRQSIECELDQYANAEDAVKAIRQAGQDGSGLPELILLDYNLPRGRGSDVLAAAAENPRLAEVPKAILTSSLRPADMEEARRLGAGCFITKPADLDEFLGEVGSTIARLLKRQAASRGTL